MNNFNQLAIGELYVLDVKDNALHIDSGRANVYVTYLVDGKPARRIFLCEGVSGDVIPSLIYSATKDLTDSPVQWRLLLKAVEETSFYLRETDEADKNNFLKKCGITMDEYTEFEEALAEKFRLQVTKDARNIYVAGQVNKDAQQNVFLRIRNLFNTGKLKRNNEFPITGNNLYDTAAAVCEWMRISYVSLKTVMDACGRKFSIEDFARLSGFASREIMLSENWYRQDIGPVLAEIAETREKVACLPYRTNRYILYYGKKKESEILTASKAEMLSAKAVMFYRPFPREAITVKKLAHFCMEEIRNCDVFGVVFFALLGLLVGLLIPYVNEQIYDLFIPLGDDSGLKGVGAVMIACAGGNLAFGLVQYLCNFRLSNRLKYSVEAASLDRLFSLPQSFFTKYDSADLAKRALSIAQIVQMVSGSLIRNGISFLLSLFYLFRMFEFSDDLSWAAIIMLAITSALIIFISNRKIPLVKSRDDLSRKNASLLYQIFTGVNKLRISNAENRAINRYMNSFIDESNDNLKISRYDYIVEIISISASTIFSIVFFFMMVKSGKDISAGKFVSFNTAFGSLSNATLSLAQEWVKINAIVPMYEKAEPILLQLPEKQEDVMVPGDIKGNIEVSNLTFSYGTDPHKTIDHVSFTIKAGEYIGIVGSSGCGKSTLMKLLLGFEKPQKGRIYYDGQDIDSVDKRELRKKFGVVLQDGGLLTGSISENITISRPNARLAEIKEAIRMAGLEEDVKEMPMGLNTVLSEGSGCISGGQKQRILIARAIVGKPKVLFFDEATSALDNNTQSVVCQSLASLNATRIVIAHRLSTIMDCDRIFVMNKGKIVEEGNYKELMAKKGLFYELVSRQIA